MSVIMYNVASQTMVYENTTDVLTKLYELKVRVPTVDDVKKYIKKHSKKSAKEKNDNINEITDILHFFGSDIEKGIKKIKKALSKIDNKLPLYDAYTGNLYLVERKNIYDRIMYKNYRFPNEELLEILQQKKEVLENEILNITSDSLSDNESKIDITKMEKEKYQNFQRKKMLTRSHHKIEQNMWFIDSFVLSILHNTFVNTLYSYSNEIGKNLTMCERPSFTIQFKHVIPYYTRDEIINIALNMGKIKSDKTYYDETKVRELCKTIRDNDVNAKNLLEHQVHIIKNKMIGLVQYYSLQGSYFINKYLRGHTEYAHKNEYLENHIEHMWKLVLDAPEFDKQYIVYRFVQTDDFISHLHIGDEYTERGFMSTTRNPFYQNETYKFGWILMKIKLPANEKGCALCIETISAFPKEEEIILPPNTKLRLLRKDDKSIYYHIDKSISKKVRTMYEFEVIGRSKVHLPERPMQSEKYIPIDFLKIDKIKSITLEEKIHNFHSRYVNDMGLFKAIIGEKEFIVKAEWFDSSTVYKNFYYLSTKNGFMLYAMFNNQLLFMIELGVQYNVPCMFVNYYIKYAAVDRDKIIGSENFITFVASIAHYFEIPIVVLYTDYASCDYNNSIDEETKLTRFYGGTYCVDFYDYIKSGIKKYADVGVLNVELIPKFRYHQLDVLKKIIPDTIITRTDENKTDDRIYQIYTKTYKDYVPEINNTLANFYTWIVENQCFLLNELIEKFKNIPQYATDDPFQNDFYMFNAIAYLYNRNKISSIPISFNELTIDSLNLKAKNDSMNRYRIVEEQRQR